MQSTQSQVSERGIPIFARFPQQHKGLCNMAKYTCGSNNKKVISSVYSKAIMYISPAPGVDLEFLRQVDEGHQCRVSVHVC